MRSLAVFFLTTFIGCQEPRCYPPSLTPHTNVGVVGLTYSYICHNFPSYVTSIEWYLNDSLYRGDYSNVKYSFTPLGSSRLTITNATIELNNTEIICSAKYSNTSICNSTRSLFLLQGHLSEVSSLQIELDLNCTYTEDVVVIQWMPPFSLDLSQIKNDILYTVEVMYESMLVLMQERVSVTYITWTLPDINPSNLSCGSFNVTVTPFNHAGYGDPTSIQKNLLSEVNTNVDVIEGYYVEKDDIMYMLKTCPAICNVKISLTDSYYNNSIKLSEANIEIVTNSSENSYIYITTLNSGLQENHKYNATYHFANSPGSSATNIISTYAIQDCILTKIHHEVILTLIYLKNTTAMGALLVFFSATSRPIVVASDLSESKNFSVPLYLSQRTLFAYDIKENGLLLPGINYPATNPKKVPNFHNDIDYIPQDLNLCNVKSIDTTITVHCDCNQTRAIIGYQVILINESNNPRRNLYASTGTCFTPATAVINKNQNYHMVVYSIQQNKGITNSEILFEGIITAAAEDNDNINGALVGLAVATVLIGISILASIIIIYYYIYFRKMRLQVARSSFSQNELTKMSREKLEEYDGSTTL